MLLVDCLLIECLIKLEAETVIQSHLRLIRFFFLLFKSIHLLICPHHHWINCLVDILQSEDLILDDLLQLSHIILNVILVCSLVLLYLARISRKSEVILHLTTTVLMIHHKVILLKYSLLRAHVAAFQILLRNVVATSFKHLVIVRPLWVKVWRWPGRDKWLLFHGGYPWEVVKRTCMAR